LIAVAGAMALGVTGCSSNSGEAKTTTTDAVQQAAAGVNTTSTGSGEVRKVTSQAVASGVQVSFTGGSPGNLVLTLA